MATDQTAAAPKLCYNGDWSLDVLISRPPRTRSLMRFVSTIWLARDWGSGGPERLLPNGRVQLLVDLDLGDASIQGPRVGPLIISTAGRHAICGVSFDVGGAYPFLQTPLAELTDQTIELRALWGPGSAAFCERVLEARTDEARLDVVEACLVERMSRAVEDDGFDLARRALSDGAAVAAVGMRLGRSPRQLIDLFRRRTGLTPKTFARIERFQRVIHGAARTPWSQLALVHGYADQAHMIREFKAFSGIVPTAYRPTSPDAHNHVLVAT